MTDTIRDLLISLASHMAYMQGQLEARHELDDPEDYYWYRESVLLRQKVTDALADESAVPTVMEIVELSSEIEAAGLGQVDFARAVLARWGNPAPVPAAEGEVGELVPVPVSERLPGPEDCDAEHYCWRWNTIGRLWARQPLARSWYEFESHWLPAHALPIPHQQENAND